MTLILLYDFDMIVVKRDIPVRISIIFKIIMILNDTGSDILIG